MRKHNRVVNGIDRIDMAASLLRGKRLGILTNASGVNSAGASTIDIISEKYDVKVLFAPEHGIRTNLQDGSWNENAVDRETGAKLINIGGENGKKAIEDSLRDLDAVVYDMQDVGARFYTYIYDIARMMRCCAELNKEVIVLDRINPIGGVGIDGMVLDIEHFSSTIGEFAIPIRYGLTIGELAHYINEEEKLGCKLQVVPCGGWNRKSYADETGLLWVNPSPNIPSVDSAVNYIGSCIFEATNISEGRGTTKPFSLIGAPFVDSKRLCDRMNAQRLEGIVFRRAFFTPKFGKYADETCEGVELHIIDRNSYSPFETMLYLYREFSYYREFEAKEHGVCIRFGNDLLCGEFIDPEGILKQAKKEQNNYRKQASKYLMY